MGRFFLAASIFLAAVAWAHETRGSFEGEAAVAGKDEAGGVPWLDSLATIAHLTGMQDREQISIFRDDPLEPDDAERVKALLRFFSEPARHKDRTLRQDLVLLLALTRDQQAVLKAFEEFEGDHKFYPAEVLVWVAWAYYKTGDSMRSQFYFSEALRKRPGYSIAATGLSYTLSAEGRQDKALSILDATAKDFPDSIEVMFARAFAYEKARRFLDALLVYDEILAIRPGDKNAQRLSIVALSDLGSHSRAFELAKKYFPDDSSLLDRLKNDMAVHRIKWGEHGEAVKILSGQKDKDVRAKFDEIAAFVKEGEMKRAVDIYGELLASGATAPSWVHMHLAKAYLELGEPRRALMHADAAYKDDHDSIETGILRSLALQDIARWNDAMAELNRLDAGIKPTSGKEYNWPALEIAVSRGWLLADQGRYGEAQKLFLNLYENAPGNTGIRTGLAHVYLWRGWPRRALKEFSIIESLGMKDVNALTGKAAALNELGYEKAAYELANSLEKSYPKDKNVKELARKLELQKRLSVDASMTYSHEDDGTSETQAGTDVVQPLGYRAAVSGHLFWRESSSDGTASYLHRAGLGFSYLLYQEPSLMLTERLTLDYMEGGDLGSYTLVEITPSDYWSFGLSYDSQTTEIPAKARASGVDSNRAEAGAGFRASDIWGANLGAAWQEFSDGNERLEGALNLERKLYAGGGLAVRGLLETFSSKNSLEDAGYFNPDYDVSATLGLAAEHIFRKTDNRVFMQKLFLSAGGYKQSGFDISEVGTVRYEHEYDFSGAQRLLLGGALTRSVYDGEAVDGYALFLSYGGKF